MSTKLSQRLIETLQPQRSRYFVRDSEVKGLAIGVNPTGRKSFYVYYRVGGGRSAMERRPLLNDLRFRRGQESLFPKRRLLTRSGPSVSQRGGDDFRHQIAIVTAGAKGAVRTTKPKNEAGRLTTTGPALVGPVGSVHTDIFSRA